jgi:hypothetical protein
MAGEGALMNVPKYHDLLVDQLGSCIQHGGASLREVPALVKKVIEEGAWQHRIIRSTGQVVEFAQFEEFVSTPPVEGLGADMRSLHRLCADDREALDLLDQAQVGRQGARTDLVNIINEVERPQGTTRQQALRKLRKDRPDLHEQVIRGEVSPHAAMVEAGFRRRTITVPIDPHAAARTLARHFDAEQRRELAETLLTID